MAIVRIPGVGLVDNVTGKVVNTNVAGGVNPNKPAKPPVVVNNANPSQTVNVPGVGQVSTQGSFIDNMYKAKQVNTKPNPTVNTGTGGGTSGNGQPSGNTGNGGIPTPPTTSGNYTNDAYGYINKVYDAKTQNQYNAFKNSYTNTMTAIDREAAKIDPNYQAEKQKATAQSELQRLNFSEYLKARGVGLGGQLQSEISRNSSLGNTLGTLQTNRQKALDATQLQRTDAATKFNQDWASYLGTSGLEKAQAIQNQKQLDAKIKAEKEAAAAKVAAEKEAAAAKVAAEKAKAATNSASSGAKANQPKPLTNAQIMGLPKTVEQQIKSQFKFVKTEKVGKDNVTTTVTYEPQEKDKPYIWKTIITSQMTPDQKWNMMNKYGLSSAPKTSSGTILGPNNLRLFFTELAKTGDVKVLVTYANKLGIKDIKDKKTGKVILSQGQQIQNIINRLRPDGTKYPTKK